MDTDSDMDGIDDGWEELNGLTVGVDDSQGDAPPFDNDGLKNIEEFRAGTDPNNPDTDGDNIGDKEEVDGTGNAFNGLPTDPTRSDSDGDLLPDGVEVSSENRFITNPNAIDTDGDMEDDNLELLQDTDPLDINSSSAALGQLIADGVRDSLYGEPIAVQTIQTGFGDNDSEWNAAYARNADGRLALLLTGNLENNFNKLEIFIDAKEGGSNTLTTAGNDGSAAMNGLKFDTSFAPDYHLIARRGGDKFDLDFADLTAATFASYQSIFGIEGEGRSATGAPIEGATLDPLPSPILVGFNNSNLAGIGGATGALADQEAAAAVTTGLEISIALGDIGNPIGEFTICVMQNNGDHDFLSNQFLGGLPETFGNLGDPKAVDLSTFEGDQFFTVPAPTVAPATFRVTAVSITEDPDTVTLSWESVSMESYQIQTSTALTGWQPIGDPISGDPGGAVTTSTVATDFSMPGTRFYRIITL